MYVALQTLTPELAPENERHALIVGMACVSVGATLVAGAFAARGASPFALTAGAFVATLIASAIVFIAVGHEAWFAPAAIFRMAFLSLLPGAILPMAPRLNADAPAQARAFGAIAQTGNIGSALGPPIFASSAAALGPVGLLLPAAALCVVGAALAVSAGRRLSFRRPSM
jgi:predicted MFS family arabinose efflux permease